MRDIIIISIFAILGLCIIAKKFVATIVDTIISLGEIQNESLVWVTVFTLVVAFIVVMIGGKARRVQTLEFIGLAWLQYMFLSWFYYGSLRTWIISEYGIEPRIVTLSLTLSILIVVGIIYFGSIYVFQPKPGIWRAYALIMVFGSLAISLNIRSQPFSLFHHAIDSKGEKVTDVNKQTVKSKFWILRDSEEEIIDLSWSAGFSEKYGKPFVRGTPEDAEDVIEYQKKHSITSKIADFKLFSSAPVVTKNVLVADYKVYQTGTYTFNMRAEETTDHWIQIANGSYGYSIKSNDDQFIVKYFDGEEVSAWSPGNWPDKYKFKIKAISSQPITFVVK